MRDSVKMTMLGVTCYAVGVCLLGGAFVGLIEAIERKPALDTQSGPECIEGYVRSSTSCVPGYDPAKGPRPARRSVYDEYATYGSAPFRRGDVR